VIFRNQFAQAPEVAAKIIASVDDELSKITAQLERARGTEMVVAKDRLLAMTFHATGPEGGSTSAQRTVRAPLPASGSAREAD
jgi:hypothetical protein